MANRLKLLIVAYDLGGGGAERELCNLLRLLPRERFDIRLCLWRLSRAYELPADVPIDVLDEGGAGWTPLVVCRLSEVVRKLRPDVVYSQLHYVSLITGLVLRARRCRARWVCRLAGNPYVEVERPCVSLTRRVFARAAVVAGCSEGVCRALVEHLRLDPARVRPLPNLVDLSAVCAAAPVAGGGSDPGERRELFTIVHAGRMAPQKNQRMLLDALALLREHRVQLWILGKGELEASLREHAARVGVADRVSWLGFRPDPFALYRVADCFALTSDHEGLPNVLIEALLCGLPAVSTRCPYGPDELIVHGENGLLTPVGDAAAFAGALRLLIEDDSLRRCLATRAAVRVAEQFDPGRVYPAYEAALLGA
jgi:glycosyltransferase involved in cell wall biosynthesis